MLFLVFFYLMEQLFRNMKQRQILGGRSQKREYENQYSASPMKIL